MRQRFGQIQVEVAAKVHWRVFGDDAFLERGEGDGNLDGGARLGAARERQLLVHHRQNPAIARVNGDYGAIHVAQGVDCRLAHHWIFSSSDIALGDVVICEGARREAFIVAVAMVVHDGGRGRWRNR